MATSTITPGTVPVKAISSLSELTESTDNIIPFRTTENMAIGTTGVTLEAYARGVYIGGTTGALMAVGYGAVQYTAFYTAGSWANAKKFT